MYWLGHNTNQKRDIKWPVKASFGRRTKVSKLELLLLPKSHFLLPTTT